MKTQRKNKNKLTKRSNKKNKQNKKTQKRKQSGGDNFTQSIKGRLSRAKARVDSVATSLLTRGMGLDWKNNLLDCEAFIERLIQKYKDQSKKYPPKLRNDYVKMKLCIKINKMLNQTDITPEVKDYLNDLHFNTCDKSSQKSMNSNLNFSM